jgi:hypothetical protein
LPSWVKALRLVRFVHETISTASYAVIGIPKICHVVLLIAAFGNLLAEGLNVFSYSLERGGSSQDQTPQTQTLNLTAS